MFAGEQLHRHDHGEDPKREKTGTHHSEGISRFLVFSIKLHPRSLVTSSGVMVFMLHPPGVKGVRWGSY